MMDAKDTQDMLFDQQIHDAFEHVTLSDEAAESMLGRLMAAQAQREEQEAASTAPQLTVIEGGRHRKAEAAPTAPRKGGWWRWLPLAASVAVAFVVLGAVGTGLFSPKGSTQASTDTLPVAKSTDEQEELLATGTTEESVSYDTEVQLNATPDEAIEESAAADTAEGMYLVDLYPSITLADGSRYTALVEGMYTSQIEDEAVGPLVDVGSATPFDATDEVACTVYELLDDPDGFAVQYDGEDTYWYCTKL